MKGLTTVETLGQHFTSNNAGNVRIQSLYKWEGHVSDSECLSLNLFLGLVVAYEFLSAESYLFYSTMLCHFIVCISLYRTFKMHLYAEILVCVCQP